MSRASLLAVSHGTDSATGRSAIAGLVDAVEAALAGVEVLAGFVDVQHPTPTEVLDAAAARLAGPPDAGFGAAPRTAPDAVQAGPASSVIVPLLLSAGYHVHVDLAAAASDRARLAAPLGPDPRLAEVAADRLARARLRPGDAVVMAAAGSSDPAALEDCEHAASLLTARLGRTVTTAYLSAAAPSVADAVATARRTGAPRVVVSPYLLAPGFFWSRAAASGADAVAQPLLTAEEAAPRQLVDLVVERYLRAARVDRDPVGAVARTAGSEASRVAVLAQA